MPYNQPNLLPDPEVANISSDHLVLSRRTLEGLFPFPLPSQAHMNFASSFRSTNLPHHTNPTNPNPAHETRLRTFFRIPYPQKEPSCSFKFNPSFSFHPLIPSPAIQRTIPSAHNILGTKAPSGPAPVCCDAMDAIIGCRGGMGCRSVCLQPSIGSACCVRGCKVGVIDFVLCCCVTASAER